MHHCDSKSLTCHERCGNPAKFSSASQSQVYVYSCFGFIGFYEAISDCDNCGIERKDFTEVDHKKIHDFISDFQKCSIVVWPVSEQRCRAGLQTYTGRRTGVSVAIWMIMIANT